MGTTYDPTNYRHYTAQRYRCCGSCGLRQKDLQHRVLPRPTWAHHLAVYAVNQEPPFAIQIEPVEGCSLACSFCALQSIRDNGAETATGTHGKNSAPYRFMTSDTAQAIANGIRISKWNPRIELAMHGEPTMHPDLHHIISVLRGHLPKHYIMLTTNGSGLLKEGAVAKLFNAGLDTLAWDEYKHATWNEKVYEVLWNYTIDNLIPFWKYPEVKEANPHHRYKGQRVIIINDISDNTDGTHKITNQGGNSGPRESLEQRCAKPFRELSIRWDGNVALCCDDWKGQYKIGNVHDMPLDALWNHPRFDAARRFLWRGMRADLTPCNGCNVRTYRNGLLPDKKGKLHMPAITDETYKLAKQAIGGKVFSIKLKRGD